MKMGPDSSKIIAKAKQLGGTVTQFEQKSGACAGWVARWIRKILMGKFDPKNKGLWDEKYFTTQILTGMSLDPEWAKKDDIPTAAKGGLILKNPTDKGSAKAESLMDKQDASKAKMLVLYAKSKKEYGEFQKVFQELPGGEADALKTAKKKLDGLEKRMVSTLGEGSAWLKRHVMKPTKAGGSSLTRDPDLRDTRTASERS
jgi:hypothetical protein